MSLQWLEKLQNNHDLNMSSITNHQIKSSNQDNQANHGSDNIQTMEPINVKYKKEEKKVPKLRFPGFEGEWMAA